MSPLIPRLQQGDSTTQRALDSLNQFLSSASVIKDGRLIQDVALASGVANDINHGLGRNPLGWFVVGTSSPATLNWIEPTLQNGWTNYGLGWQTAGYSIDDRGIVRLRGLIKDGTLNTTIFALPAAYTPAQGAIFPAFADRTFAFVQVGSDGLVGVYSSTNYNLSLDGISLQVGTATLADVWEDKSGNSIPDRILRLHAASNRTVSLWVF